MKGTYRRKGKGRGERVGAQRKKGEWEKGEKGI